MVFLTVLCHLQIYEKGDNEMDYRIKSKEDKRTFFDYLKIMFHLYYNKI